MHPFGPAVVENAPAHVLFPEAYAATKRQIMKDFAFFGAYIVAGVVLVAMTAVAIG